MSRIAKVKNSLKAFKSHKFLYKYYINMFSKMLHGIQYVYEYVLQKKKMHKRREMADLRNLVRCSQFNLPREAMCSAVFPFFVAASTIAPRVSSSLTISKCPSFAAKCKAFSPFYRTFKEFPFKNPCMVTIQN
jgi:hypothetical protein